jgi:hypothetical protein
VSHPRYSADTTRESSPGTVRPDRHYAAIPCAGTARGLCRHASVLPKHYVACSCPPTASPSKGHRSNLEGCTGGDQAHDPGDIVAWDARSTAYPPSSALCGHSRRCGALCRRDVATPVPMHPRPFPQQDPRTSMGAPSNQHTDDDHTWTPIKSTLEAISGQIQELPRRPRKPGFIIKPPRRREYARTTVTPGALYAGTSSLYITSCSTSLSCHPLAYKRRRQPPNCRHPHSHSRIHICFHTTLTLPDIGTSPQSS